MTAAARVPITETARAMRKPACRGTITMVARWCIGVGIGNAITIAKAAFIAPDVNHLCPSIT